MGKSDAKAISPKPSTSVLLPSMFSANPNPKAATNGTVTVEVVTPPLSYAMGIMYFGAKYVIIITNA